MNSYQKLKTKLKAKDEEIQRLLTDQEYYMTCVIANNVRRGIDRAVMFGEPYMIHKPTGKLKFKGLLNKITKC